MRKKEMKNKISIELKKELINLVGKDNSKLARTVIKKLMTKKLNEMWAEGKLPHRSCTMDTAPGPDKTSVLLVVRDIKTGKCLTLGELIDPQLPIKFVEKKHEKSTKTKTL